MVNPQPNPTTTPALNETIRALTDYGTTNEELDLLALVEWVTKTHTGSTHEIPDGTVRACVECGATWPCPSWQEIQSLTLMWLVQSSNAAIETSRAHLRSNT